MNTKQIIDHLAILTDEHFMHQLEIARDSDRSYEEDEEFDWGDWNDDWNDCEVVDWKQDGF